MCVSVSVSVCVCVCMCEGECVRVSWTGTEAGPRVYTRNQVRKTDNGDELFQRSLPREPSPPTQLQPHRLLFQSPRLFQTHRDSGMPKEIRLTATSATKSDKKHAAPAQRS